MVRSLKKINAKRSQSEVIVTVLLIMIGIAAVVIVAGFVISLVKNNLKGGECFDTAGQLIINNDPDVTFYNSTGNKTMVNIGRGVKSFELEGIQITLGNKDTTKAYQIKISGGSSEVSMANGGTMELPNASESRTYKVNVANSNLNSIIKVKVVAMIKDGRLCAESTDEKDIVTKSY